MTIDHENFTIVSLPAYNATAKAYFLIAKAYKQAALALQPEQEGFDAAFLDAASAAEKYADHCASVVAAATTEGSEWAAAYDFKYGPDAHDFAECQIREASDLFGDDDYAEADRQIAETDAFMVEYQNRNTPFAGRERKSSPLDGGTLLRPAL
jgi:hypothetical protein